MSKRSNWTLRQVRYFVLKNSIVGGQRLGGLLEAVVLVLERYPRHGLRVAQRHQPGHVLVLRPRLTFLKEKKSNALQLEI